MHIGLATCCTTVDLYLCLMETQERQQLLQLKGSCLVVESLFPLATPSQGASCSLQEGDVSWKLLLS